MARYDRYMLSQLLLIFGFCALILVGLFWINRAVRLFDRLLGDGQSVLVFLEFSALGLPRLIATVLPIAAFSATVYVTNRMINDSEFAVLQATGNSPWRLARPVIVFGICVALMMSILSHFLVPMAQSQLKTREYEVSQNVTSGLFRAGQFLHPAPLVTFYTREIDETGVLRDVFLSDRRAPDEGAIYTAKEAYLIRNGEKSTLIMVDGLAQRVTNDAQRRLATATFRDLSFDISGLVTEGGVARQTAPNTVTPLLIGSWDKIAAQTGDQPGVIAEEVHTRFARALFCLTAALIGFATLLTGGYSRLGVWREVAFAFGALVALDGLRSTAVTLVRDDPVNWAILYLPSVAGVAFALGVLAYLSRPIRRRSGVKIS
ncbi:MAG: LPS export ABC transporter permease LptF [Pseudomonadota bacterium]